MNLEEDLKMSLPIVEESNPRIPRKKGQPANSKKHSDLYTDENPKGTIHGLGFKDVATAKASVSKIRGSSRSHAHKIQAAVAMEQRAREMGKTSEASVYRKYINSMKKKTKKMNEAANPAQQAAIAINMKKKGKKPKSMNEGSLHKWFKGSKSKDGKGGWVNVVTGGTCASDEPGEGTPKCVSSSKRASMSKKERLSAARRKKKADPNQQSKTGAAKPTYVATDKSKKKMKEELEYIDLPLEVEIPNTESKFNLGLMFRESLDIDKGMLFIFEEVGKHSFHMKNTRIPLDVAFIKEDGTIESIKELNPHTILPVSSDGEVLFAIEANRGWFIENNVEVGDEIVLGEGKDKKGKGSGKKDACYHKVKSRYDVWPSAYASGALVKCRKVGAANWGNKSESVKLDELKLSPKDKEGLNKSVKAAVTNASRKVGLNRPEAMRFEPKSEGYIPEEGYDVARDQGRVRPSKDKKDATTMPPSNEMRKTQKVNKGPSALDRVKAKYGKSVMKMGEELDSKDKPFVKDLVKKLRGGSKTHAKQADDLEKAVNEDIKRDEYGDPIGGPKISKKQKAKNLASNTPDEQHTTTTSEAKVDKPMIFGKSLARNERKFGKKGSTQPQGYFGQKPSQAAELSKKRTDEHKAKRGVKTKGVMEDVVTEKCWPGYEKKGMKTMFGKRYPNCVKKKVKKEEFSNWRDEIGFEGKDSSKKIDEDWQKVNRKDKTDGLSQKAVNAYRRENPGSKLKTAVTKDPKKLKKGSKSAKRRLSFCRRMKGMKKKLTSAKTSRDPDSRINKALRRWNCSYEPTGTTIAEKALSKKQQKFFGIVRAAQKGTLDGEASPQVQRAAASMTQKDVKKFASTKHKGLPEKIKSEE